jgi:hypothetical protein
LAGVHRKILDNLVQLFLNPNARQGRRQHEVDADRRIRQGEGQRPADQIGQVDNSALRHVSLGKGEDLPGQGREEASSWDRRSGP